MTPSEERVHIRWGMVIIGCIIFSIIFAILSGCGEWRVMQMRGDGMAVITNGDRTEVVVLTQTLPVGSCVEAADERGFIWQPVACEE